MEQSGSLKAEKLDGLKTCQVFQFSCILYILIICPTTKGKLSGSKKNRARKSKAWKFPQRRQEGNHRSVLHWHEIFRQAIYTFL